MYILIKLTEQEIKYIYFFLKFLLVLSQFVTLPTKLGTIVLSQLFEIVFKFNINTTTHVGQNGTSRSLRGLWGLRT